MPNLVIGLFPESTDAAAVVADLKSQGFERTTISIRNRNADADSDIPERRKETESLTTLFQDQQIPGDDAEYFAEGYRRGGTVIAVRTATQDDGRRAASILDSHGALDIDQRIAEWKRSGWQPVGKEAHAMAAAAAGRAGQVARSEEGLQTGRTRGSRIFIW